MRSLGATKSLVERGLMTTREIDGDERNALLRAAHEAAEQSYSPYSGVKVGAALRTASGRIWLGANIGNSCSTLNCCAEQVAIVQAVLAKDYPFTAIAVVQKMGPLCPPCGRCLQLLAEFSENMNIVCLDRDTVVHWVRWTPSVGQESG
jgi:cytidine deaminase